MKTSLSAQNSNQTTHHIHENFIPKREQFVALPEDVKKYTMTKYKDYEFTEDYIASMMLSLNEIITNVCKNMKKSLEQKDMPALATKSHTLKCVLLNNGLPYWADLAGIIENAANVKQNEKLLADIFDELLHGLRLFMQ